MNNIVKNKKLWRKFRIRALELNKGVSEIGREIGLSRASIYYFLMGQRKLADSTIERLCKSLNVPSDFFEEN